MEISRTYSKIFNDNFDKLKKKPFQLGFIVFILRWYIWNILNIFYALECDNR